MMAMQRIFGRHGSWVSLWWASPYEPFTNPGLYLSVRLGRGLRARIWQRRVLRVRSRVRR